MTPSTQHQKSTIFAAFERDYITLPITAILPLRTLPPTIRASRVPESPASVSEVGLVEPPVVARSSTQRNTYLLVDAMFGWKS